MMPSHGAAAQASIAPYIISITPAYYSSGTTVTGKSIHSVMFVSIKTSLPPPLFTEVPVPSQECSLSCICVL